jgi:hypothetical protein
MGEEQIRRSKKMKTDWLDLKKREWLEADGLGGFACGTASGIRSRRYHALLLAATTPPTGRMVLVNGFDARTDQRRVHGVDQPDLVRLRVLPANLDKRTGHERPSTVDRSFPEPHHEPGPPATEFVGAARHTRAA